MDRVEGNPGVNEHWQAGEWLARGQSCERAKSQRGEGAVAAGSNLIRECNVKSLGAHDV